MGHGRKGGGRGSDDDRGADERAKTADPDPDEVSAGTVLAGEAREA